MSLLLYYLLRCKLFVLLIHCLYFKRCTPFLYLKNVLGTKSFFPIAMPYLAISTTALPTAKGTIRTSSNAFQKQSHSPKTHHLALRSANTNPLQTPLSPILIIVSHVPPSASELPPPLITSFFLVNRRTFPLGA